MSYQYAETDETLTDFFPNIDTDNTEKVALITRLLQAASVMIDQYTRRPPGYFTAAAEVDEDNPKTVRRFRGRGENFLRVGRYVPGTAEITGFAAGTFYEADNGWLFATDTAATGPGYNDDVCTRPIKLFQREAVYLVKARWGFAETPGDIVTACKMFAQHLYDRGQGTFGQVTPAGFVIERDMPPPVRLMLDGWVRGEFELN